MKKKDDRKIKASISRAVEIVDQIDDDALCGLTLVHAINNWTAVSGDISHGLTVMNDLFSSLCYRELPNGFEWVYHLDILDAVRSSSVSTFKKFKDYYPSKFTGYTCAGIQKDSENHSMALEILREANLPVDVLVPHELNDGYMRLFMPHKESIANIELLSARNAQVVGAKKITIQEADALNQIWDLYSTDDKIIENVKNAFMEKWDTYGALHSIRIWWENLPRSFTITPIGKVLAHANAQRYCNNVPDMNI